MRKGAPVRTTDPLPADPEHSSGRGVAFRPEIDGLRAVAIVGVVLFHAEAPFMAGGFVGVDVFFVISGYLITSHLIRPSDGRGSVDLIGFWARRIRRLLPAMTVMLVVTAALILLLLAPSDAVLWAPWAAASALYVPNIALAALD